MLDQAVRTAIIEDIQAQYWDAILLGTPCETYSALMEIKPGPCPLRSPQELNGISKGLTPQKKKQLEEGNEHTEFYSDVMKTAHGMYTPFTVENPEPLHPVSIFNMSAFKEVARLRAVRTTDFDQCRVGCEAKKPTRLMHYRIQYRGTSNLRCNHEPRFFGDADGKAKGYKAAHEKVAQRRRSTAEGGSEFASQGHWGTILLRSASSSQGPSQTSTWSELQAEPLP